MTKVLRYNLYSVIINDPNSSDQICPGTQFWSWFKFKFSLFNYVYTHSLKNSNKDTISIQLSILL